MNKTFFKIISLFVPIKKYRKKLRNCYPFCNKWTRLTKKTAQNVGNGLACYGETIVNKNCYIGDNVIFNGCKVYGAGKVTFGSHIHSGVELMILCQNHNYNHGEHIPFSPDDYIFRDVEIKDFVWIGSRVTILPGTVIGEGAIIQAGAVIRGNIPDYAIVGGNPAQIIKYRDIDHFKRLKDLKKFY